MRLIARPALRVGLFFGALLNMIPLGSVCRNCPAFGEYAKARQCRIMGI